MIEICIKQGPNGIGKCKKKMVNCTDVPYCVQVWECALPPR